MQIVYERHNQQIVLNLQESSLYIYAILSGMNRVQEGITSLGCPSEQNI
jgi:hypothetical protein